MTSDQKKKWNGKINAIESYIHSFEYGVTMFQRLLLKAKKMAEDSPCKIENEEMDAIDNMQEDLRERYEWLQYKGNYIIAAVLSLHFTSSY